MNSADACRMVSLVRSASLVTIDEASAEDVEGLLAPAGEVEGVAEHQGGVEQPPPRPGRPGQADGELVVLGLRGPSGWPPGRLPTSATPAVEAPDRHPERVPAVDLTLGLGGVGQGPAQPCPSDGGQVGPHHLPVERVVEPELGPRVADRGVEQAPCLELFDGLQGDQPLEQGEVNRVTEGHQLEGLELELVQAHQPLLDQVAQARGVGQGAVEAPQAQLGYQGTRLEGPLDELPEEEHVAGTGLHQGLEGGTVDRAADGQRGQGAQVALGEGADLDPERLLLLPHPPPPRGPLAGPHGEDEEGAPRPPAG